MTTAFHPQSDGQSESANRVIVMYLRCLTGDRPRQWVRWLPWAEYLFNTAYQSSLRDTPFRVVYGRDPPSIRSYEPSDTRVQAVAKTMEKYEVATVTAVGKPGTQGRLSAAAPRGTSTLKVGNVDNISVGDKIRLDIESVGHGIEWVTVTAVGTAGANGTGLTVAETLKFDHAANMPFSDRGTGISFSPPTTAAHSSNEPVQALGSGITIDKPLSTDHPIDAVVRDARVTTAGYQYQQDSGSGTPNQWFGGPAFSGNAGSIVSIEAAFRACMAAMSATNSPKDCLARLEAGEDGCVGRVLSSLLRLTTNR